jgi:hypothetical protein
MSERKPCIRCERGIDAWSKVCPFCNWNQLDVPPPNALVPTPVADYTPPEEQNLKRKGWLAGAGALLLVASFGVGMVINRDGAPKNAPPAVEEKHESVAPVKRADMPLVPMTGAPDVEQPITSAPSSSPAEGIPAEYQRSDATAASAVEYAQLARRAKTEKKNATLVDPRSLTGSAYAQGPRATTPRRTLMGGETPSSAPAAEPQRVALRTRPVPQYQPVPPVRGVGSMRLDLMIGADGRVKRITVHNGVGGSTAAIVGAVQSWRFKPATENGEPVAAPYSVQLSFGGR